MFGLNYTAIFFNRNFFGKASDTIIWISLRHIFEGRLMIDLIGWPQFYCSKEENVPN